MQQCAELRDQNGLVVGIQIRGGQASVTFSSSDTTGASVLEVPTNQIFYEGGKPPKLPSLLKRKIADDIACGSEGKEAILLAKLCRLFSRMEEGDLGFLLFMAQKMARTKAV